MKRIFLIFLLLECFSDFILTKKRVGTRRVDDEDLPDFLFKQKLHKLKSLTRKAAKRLVNDLDDYESFRTNYLKNIMRVRVPGTIGHHEVKKFIIKTLEDYNWKVQLDEFDSPTPLGLKKFTNIIATLNPAADRRLALVAHYDSKLLTPENGKYFVAATDSAVPCAMLLDVAKLIAQKAIDKRGAIKEVSPMLIFLDGEEAFMEWTKDDSIYGARHLADALSNTPHHNSRSYANVNMLQSLDAFVLLDLLGAKNPTFFDLYPETSNLFKAMQNIERNLLSTNQINNTSPYFVGPPSSPLYVEDDHIPFLHKGVPILHLIAIPFPKVWHTLQDDESALDPSTIMNLLKILRQFAIEYFHLN